MRSRRVDVGWLAAWSRGKGGRRTMRGRSRRVATLTLFGLVAGLACAGAPRVEAEPPDVPHWLIFTGTYGYRHARLPELASSIIQRGELYGSPYTAEWTEDPNVLFDPATYRRIDGVVLLSTTGLGGASSPFDTDEEREMFLDFFRCGGALVGVHAATDSGDAWPEFTDLIGARFESHPHFSLEADPSQYPNPTGDPQLLNVHPLISDVSILVEDDVHVATRPWHGMESFRITDEIYRYAENPRDKEGVHVLLSLDENTHYWPYAAQAAPNPVQLVPPVAFPARNPIAWTKTYGDGRVFYTNLGHSVSTHNRADFAEHLAGGMKWASSVRPAEACIASEIG